MRNFGFAKGNYMCACVSCKQPFIGDKRAIRCEECAEELAKQAAKQESIYK